MERLEIRRESVHKAVEKFGETVHRFQQKDASHVHYDELRDSLIKRFEFSIDTFWKFLMLYMTDNLKVTIDQASPKQIFQRALELKLITVAEHRECIVMINDRNMTSHTYNEVLAEDISHNLPQYFEILRSIIERLSLDR